MRKEQGSFVDTVSKRGFGEIIGVSPGRVSQMIAAGLPVEPNGRIEIGKGKAWVDANIDPGRRRHRLNGEAPYISARSERDTAEAEIARLKADRLAGKLIDRDATLRAVESRARFERDTWIGWVNRAAPEIAAALNGDLALAVPLLDRLVRDHLAMLAETPIAGLAS